MDTWRSMLRGADGLIAEVVAGHRLGHHWIRLSVGMGLCAAVYGAVLGLWHGPRLAAYSAVKLPLVLLLTSLLTVAFSWLAAVILGLPLRFGQVAVLTFLALAAGRPPPALPGARGLDLHGLRSGARTAHNLLYLLHTTFVGGCGIAGSVALWKAMRRRPPPVHPLAGGPPP